MAHHGDHIGASLQHGKLGRHDLSLRQLMLSAVRHQHAASPDRGVEHLNQPLLGTHVQVV